MGGSQHRFTKGKVYLNAKAVEAVCGDRAVSILPVGVTHVEGDLKKVTGTYHVARGAESGSGACGI